MRLPVLAADYEWTRSITGGVTNGDWLPVGADDSGVYYATGDSHLAKYGHDGTPLWDHSLPITGGSAGIDDLAVDDSGVYLTGPISGHWPGQPMPSADLDAYVARYTSDGDLVWALQFTPPASLSPSLDTRLALAPGAVYMSLAWFDGQGMIAKVDRSGTVAWQHNRTFGGEMASMAADADGAVVATIGEGLTAFGPAGTVRWTSLNATAGATWDLVAAPGGGTYALQLGNAGTHDAVRVRKYATNGAIGIGHLIASRPTASPTGIAVLGERVYVGWSSGTRRYALDHANWATLDTNLNIIWSRSHALTAAQLDGYRFTALTASSRGAYLIDGATLAKVSIDNEPTVARWQDYAFPPRLPLPDDYLTGLASWKGHDDVSEIDFFEVQQSENGGAWSDVTLKDATVKSTLISGEAAPLTASGSGPRTCRATWASGTQPGLRAVIGTGQQQAINYDANWKLAHDADASGGSVMTASKAGATAQFQFKGDAFGFVTIVGPDRGKVAMFVDGTKITTLDLYSKAQQTQYVSFARSWGSVGNHTVKLVAPGNRRPPDS